MTTILHNGARNPTLDVSSDSVTGNTLRFCPQVSNELGIWDLVSPSNTSLYLDYESVDDLITYLEYYKHKKMENDTWHHNS